MAIDFGARDGWTDGWAFLSSYQWGWCEAAHFFWSVKRREMVWDCLTSEGRLVGRGICLGV